MSFFAWALKDIKSRQNLDVWILAALAVIFAVLGIVGLDAKFLGPCMLGLLGVLAISQIKSRDQISKVATTWQRGRTDIFSDDFPEEYYNARAKASSHYFFAGMSMKRTLPTMERDIKRILRNNGTVRILLPDPTDENLIQMIATTRSQNSEEVIVDIQNSLTSAKNIRSQLGTNLEIRTTRVLPRVGINALELGLPSATLMVQMYGFAPANEAKPIFLLTPADKEWFEHFEDETDRLWKAGSYYP
ncbi:hypothetical protein [Arthrobacter sp. QXT-31]|uniref:hypothetical protein n=1 Tax=Arthrobacter sp. QXT-31 TaxID=1357915 RepID=UPI0012F82A49|nr:hypothetical protein [Arthrobacter sp. QXT-31]